MSIRSKIQALITAANNTTGESDTTLTNAVQTLVDGYGQGGGGGGNNYAPWTASGEIELINEHVYTLDLPVQCPTTHAKVRFTAIESGVVENGEITKDSELTVHLPQRIVFDYVLTNFPITFVSVNGSYGTYSAAPKGAIDLAGYATTTRGLTYITLIGASVITSNMTILNDGKIRITTGYPSSSSGYMFCFDGLYMKFRYEIMGVNLS